MSLIIILRLQKVKEFHRQNDIYSSITSRKIYTDQLQLTENCSKIIKDETNTDTEIANYSKIDESNMAASTSCKVEESLSISPVAKICNAVFIGSEKNSKPYKLKIKINLPRCDICGEYYTNLELLERHKLDDHQLKQQLDEPEIFQCNQCEKQYKYKKGLMRHIRAHHFSLKPPPNKTYPQFRNVSGSKKHLETQKSSELHKKFKCHRCSMLFTCKKTLNQHKVMYHSQSNSILGKSCTICGKKILNDFNLERHMKTHIPDEKRTKFKCQFCSSTFTRKENVNKHIRLFHQKSNKRLNKVCPICKTVFLHDCSLKRHLKIHEQYDNFQSQIKMENDNLTEYVASTHAPSKKRCKICRKLFRSNYHAKRHMETHLSNELRTKFDCQFCEKSFTRKENLNKHMISCHSKPNTQLKKACQFCNKIFPDDNNLQKHIETHEQYQYSKINITESQITRNALTKQFGLQNSKVNEQLEKTCAQKRPHSKSNQTCYVCYKKFTRFHILKRHLETHKPAEERDKFQCDCCEKCFFRRDSLNRHMLMYHSRLKKMQDLCQ